MQVREGFQLSKVSPCLKLFVCLFLTFALGKNTEIHLNIFSKKHCSWGANEHDKKKTSRMSSSLAGILKYLMVRVFKFLNFLIPTIVWAIISPSSSLNTHKIFRGNLPKSIKSIQVCFNLNWRATRTSSLLYSLYPTGLHVLV